MTIYKKIMVEPDNGLVARMYNGLDERKGWPIIEVKPRPLKVKRKPWWKKVLGL